MKKRTTALAVILAVILVLVLALVAIFSFTSGNNPPDDSNVPPDDPMWHGNGMEELPIPVEDTEGNTGDDTPGKVEQPKVYTLMCRFEGKMDANSFEVTELDTDTEKGEFVDGPLMQMRVGNEAVRQDVDVLEIGENITIIFTYNEDSQPVADRIMFLSR